MCMNLYFKIMNKQFLVTVIMIIVSCLPFSVSSQGNIPNGLEVTNISSSAATLSWNNNPDASYWLVSFVVFQGNTPEYLDVLEGSSVVVNNLTSGLRYLWRVKMIDNNGDTSQWSPFSSFVTLGNGTGCESVSALTLESMSNSDGLTVQWYPGENQSQWEVVCGETGSNPDTEGLRYFTSNLYQSISGIEPLNMYQVAIRAICSGTLSDWSYINVRYLPETYNWNLPVQASFETEYERSRVGFTNSIFNA